MTDFGRRTGTGDMLKSIYDADEDGVIAVAQTEADMTKAVYDTDDDGYVDGLADHAELHEDAGDEEIDVTGLVGTTPLAILGDATAGRALRIIDFTVDNGSNASTLKCTVTNHFNGDAIAETDNIAKDATTGHFTLDAAGQRLTIEVAGLSGNVIAATGFIVRNKSGTAHTAHLHRTGNDIYILLRGIDSGSAADWTVPVDTGAIYLQITYITDA